MRRNLPFYILIGLALAALVALIVLLAPGAAPDTPPVILSPPPAADSAGAPSAEPTAAARVIAVTPETVQAAIATLTRADSYSRTLTVRSFWDGGGSSSEIGVWARGGSTRVTIRNGAESADGTVKNILLKDGGKWIWYSDAEGVWQGPARERDADAWQTLPTWEDVLALDKSAITDAGYADFGGEDCIFVRYADGPLGYETVCYVSDRTGLLMGAETWDGDTLVYAMRSTPPDISTPDERIFDEP